MSAATGVFAINGCALALFTNAKGQFGPPKDHGSAQKMAALSIAAGS
jgi:hypothetical protein